MGIGEGVTLARKELGEATLKGTEGAGEEGVPTEEGEARGVKDADDKGGSWEAPTVGEKVVDDSGKEIAGEGGRLGELVLKSLG
jgi:hypothetical protein